MAEEEYKSGKWTQAVHSGSSNIPSRIDEELRDQALTDVITKKVKKSYARTPGLPTWLVVFSTTHYLTEYVQYGEIQTSEALRRARDYLSACSRSVFQEVWFTDLQTRPIEVWRAPSTST
jgi:hypothetical protein